MKQKSIYYLLLVGVITLTTMFTGCTEDFAREMTTNPISFAIDEMGFEEGSTRTRGAKVNLVSNFGVSASVYSASSTFTSAGCGSYFFDESATAGTPMGYYWPTSNYKLSFFGYYPKGNAAFTLQSTANTIGAPTYAYTVPSAIANQVDIMTGQDLNHLGGGTTPVSLTMKHRCSAICFSVTNSRSSAIILNSISIEGVKYSGTLNEEAWTLTSAVNSSSSNPFTLSYGSSIAASATVNVTGTTNIFLMLPQTIPAGAKVKVVIDGEDPLYADLTGTWIAGRQYNYTLDVQNSTIVIVDEDSDIEDWEKLPLKITQTLSGSQKLYIPAAVTTDYMTSVSYSIDNGETWTTVANRNEDVTITTPVVDGYQPVLWKGVGNSLAVDYYNDTNRSVFQLYGGDIKVEGNLMSLIGNGPMGNYAFCGLFRNNTNIITAPELPATTLADYCYYGLFENCTSLTSAPELPATTMADWCYGRMFSGCTSLTNAPELPAETLAPQCYLCMFQNCSALTSAPELPATTLSNKCYGGMFAGCSSLASAPELPATTLTNNCYADMFNGCSSLTSAPELPATTMANYCYSKMFMDCTSLTTAPNIPASSLAKSCFRYMFGNCTALTTAPEVCSGGPTLISGCCENMFYECSSLSYIKCGFTGDSSSALSGWVYHVQNSSGTFIKRSDCSLTRIGYNGIPSGWTVQTYTP